MVFEDNRGRSIRAAIIDENDLPNAARGRVDRFHCIREKRGQCCLFIETGNDNGKERLHREKESEPSSNRIQVDFALRLQKRAP